MGFLTNPEQENLFNSMVEYSCLRLMNTPVGTLRIKGNAEAVTAVEFDDKHEYYIEGELTAPVEMCMNQLHEYFDGQRTEFTVPIELDGTKFQQRVWAALKDIPFADTVSYGTIADRIQLPKGQRAVGTANNHNPVAIIVPCHRVVGADGKLVGYAGGVWRKAWLLELEAKVAGKAPLNLL